MAWTETWSDAQRRMLGQMADISRQFEEYYGSDVVAAVLMGARDKGIVPSDPQDFGALFVGVSPRSKPAIEDRTGCERTLDIVA